MNNSFGTETQISILENIHEELLYAIECLVEDYTREARYTLSDVVKRNDFIDLHELYRSHIETNLDKIYTGLMTSSPDAKTSLIRLRREIRNTLCKLNGKELVYNYANAIGVRVESGGIL